MSWQRDLQQADGLRRDGREVAELNDQRARLQRFLSEWIPKVEALPARGKLRWVLDVDPLEVF